LDSSMLVIADQNKACALAGVMGGLNSEIENDTVTVVFESACFSGPDTRVTAKKNGMRTESSARFEKGLDPENCLPGLMRACQLVELLGAGDVVDGLIDVYPGKKEQVILPFTPDKYNKFLGTEIDEQTMIDILATLECRVENGNVYVPSFRSDLGCMQDIAEEIVRIWGYDKIPSSCIKAETTQGMRTPKQKLFVATEQLMYGMGISQIQTFSFISPKYYDAIALPADSALRTSVVISNPLGEDTSVMRTTALPSLMEVLQRNNNFSNQNVRLFEMATIYLPDADITKLPEEKTVVTVGMYGDADFYDMKGAVENLLTMAGVKGAQYVACTENPSYHPGRCATVTTADGKYLAVFGQIHPVVADNYGMSIPVLCAEIDFDALFAVSNTEPDYKPLPKFPAATRDYAFVCAEELEVGKIMSVIAKAGGALVENVELFDIFRGEKLGAGNKSVAFRVTLRAADRTLTVEEADKISKKIINDLKFKLGIALRA
ncbi:MAG: phenylalanine--tRNA ligase subunit beta, partial [Clostridia bacterium]|nr:phenylalanine--tRNA ligase subunit beta [Clostridia bacterium]